jgi:hypothetical protein
MKNIAYILLLLVAPSCGNPSLTGVAQTTAYETVRLFMDNTGVTMTAAPAIGAEPANNVSRTYVDLTYFSSARAQFTSSLANNIINCRIEYSLDDGSTWSTLVSNFAASAVAQTANKSNFETIPTAARTDVLVRGIIVGNGALNPIIRYISLDLKGS